MVVAQKFRAIQDRIRHNIYCAVSKGNIQDPTFLHLTGVGGVIACVYAR